MNYDCLSGLSQVDTEDGFCVRDINQKPEWYNARTGKRGQIVKNPVDGMVHFIEKVKA